MKKKIALILAIISLISLLPVSHVFAQQPEVSYPIEGEIDERYIVSCPSGDKHFMEGRGEGRAYEGAYGENPVLRIAGQASQCRYCNLVLITENNPFQAFVETWGLYTTWSSNDPVPVGIVNVYTDAFLYNDDPADPYVQGFEFSFFR